MAGKEIGLVRRDTQGKAIAEGDRYKITFRDRSDVGKPIDDIIYVESYKKYNQMDVEEETTICKCAIF